MRAHFEGVLSAEDRIAASVLRVRARMPFFGALALFVDHGFEVRIVHCFQLLDLGSQRFLSCHLLSFLSTQHLVHMRK